jgi:hypothetical protein
MPLKILRGQNELLPKETQSVDAHFHSAIDDRDCAQSGNGASEFHNFDRYHYGPHEQEVEAESEEGSGRCGSRGQVNGRGFDRCDSNHNYNYKEEQEIKGRDS